MTADDFDTEEEIMRYYQRKKNAKSIKALWCKEGDYSWTYSTDIPHATFEVVDDGKPYCRGIVFALSDIEPPAKEKRDAAIDALLHVEAELPDSYQPYDLLAAAYDAISAGKIPHVRIE